MKADHVFSTLPAEELSRLLFPFCEESAKILREIPFASVGVVNFGYRHKMFEHSGFGYLIPSKERTENLGRCLGFLCFSYQNYYPEETRLTVMLGGMHHPEICTMPSAEMINTALESVVEHMHIKEIPDVIHCKRAWNSIPQYLVGHQKK